MRDQADKGTDGQTAETSHSPRFPRVRVPSSRLDPCPRSDLPRRHDDMAAAQEVFEAFFGPGIFMNPAQRGQQRHQGGAQQGPAPYRDANSEAGGVEGTGCDNDDTRVQKRDPFVFVTQ